MTQPTQAQIEAAAKQIWMRHHPMLDGNWQDYIGDAEVAFGELTAAAEVGRKYVDGDPLVTELIWEVDRAVKQAAANDGKYETVIRHILNKYITAAAEVGEPNIDNLTIYTKGPIHVSDHNATIERCAQVAEKEGGHWAVVAAIRALKDQS